MSALDGQVPDFRLSDAETREAMLDAEAEGAVADAAAAKEDAGKLRWSLLPWRQLEVLVQVMEYGATKKYAPGSWRHVENGEARYLDAATRHLAAIHKGEHINPENGLPHLACAACSCLLALAHRMENT